VRTLAELQSGAAGLVDQFTNPKGHYAWRTYDQSPADSEVLQPSDVLMANLLSLRLGWKDVTPLFAEEDTAKTRLRQALDLALREARSLPPLDRCDDDQLAMPALARANTATKDVPNWTPTTVSKVLHRLAPTVPLTDSYLRKFYGVAAGQGQKFRQRLRDDLDANRKWLERLAARHRVRGQPAPLCRTGDIVVWMASR
jgi:hypothetical protein